MRTIYFLLMMLVVLLTQQFVVISAINWSQTNICYTIIWLLFYTYLSFGTSYILISTIVYAFYRIKQHFIHPTISLPHNKYNFRAAVLYFVKNEGALFGQLLEQSLNCNNKQEFAESVDYFVISNSNKSDNLAEEKQIVQNLQAKYGSKIKYFTAKPPKHVGFQQWIKEFQDSYKYCITCDADTTLPKNSISDLVAFMEHNPRVAITQSRIEIHGQSTWFSYFSSIGQNIVARLHTVANTIMFQTGCYYGSGAIIRVKDMVGLRLSENVKCHDIWESSILQSHNLAVYNHPDIVTCEMTPDNYIEQLSRGKRWIAGTIQTHEMLASPDIRPSVYPYIVLPIYIYFSQPVFCLWLIIGFAGGAKNLIIIDNYDLFQQVFEFVMLVIIGYRFVAIKRFYDVPLLISETVFSTLLYLNSMIYITLDILEVILATKFEWVPTIKKSGIPSWLELIKFFWPSTLIGLTLLYFWLITGLGFIQWALPLIVSFTLVIPNSRITSIPIPKSLSSVLPYIKL